MDKEFTRYEKLSNKDFDLFLMTYQECLPKNVNIIDEIMLEANEIPNEEYPSDHHKLHQCQHNH